ncbi:MAG: transcriptional regulator [Bacteriovoracaceae bacterium]|nr:transcriptional regulator [Bacteriovoracaceae bacterium]
MTKKCKRQSLKITDEHRAIRELRLSKNLSLEEASRPLGIKSKALGHIENGRVKLTKEKIDKIVSSLGFHYHDFLRAKKKVKDDVKNRVQRKTIKRVLKNSDRRSYQKIITKEVKAIKALRILKKISQDKASNLCGYSRPTFGHIENGRIILDSDRINHIVCSLGFKRDDFEKYLNAEITRDVIINDCKQKILDLSDDQLMLINGIVRAMK